MQYILFVILSFLIGTILFYLSNNKCEPFTIGNDIQISKNLNLTESCECAKELPTSISEEFTIEPGKAYKVTKETSIYESGSLTNDGILCIEPNIRLYIYGNFENKGIINNDGYISHIGTITNSSGGTITNNYFIGNNISGTITNSSGGTITNNNLIYNYNMANITNSNGATINNNKIIKNYNSATITNSSGATIINNKNIDNNESATFTNSSGATIINSSGAYITNCATFTTSGKITDYGSICSIKTGDIQNVPSVKVCDSHLCSPT